MLLIFSWKKRGKDHSGTNLNELLPSPVRLSSSALLVFNGKSAVVNALFGAFAHPVQGGGAGIFALGRRSGIGSAAVNFSNVNIDGTYIRKWGGTIDCASLPLSIAKISTLQQEGAYHTSTLL